MGIAAVTSPPIFGDAANGWARHLLLSTEGPVPLECRCPFAGQSRAAMRSAIGGRALGLDGSDR